MIQESGLILEGGGMRGAYTAGVLQYFMEKELELSYVIGVSAGVCQGASYISKQLGRNKKVTIDMSLDPRYIRYKGIFDGTGLFNMDFIFNKIPNELVKYDYDAYKKSKQKLIAVATDCLTGNPVYLDCHSAQTNEELNMMFRASSSLPLFAPVVNLRDLKLLDGGLSDSIPIKKAIDDGNKKNIVILTRPRGYRKSPSKGHIIYKTLLGKECSGAVYALKNRYIHYNQTLDELEKYKNKGLAYVIAPSQDLKIKRAEKDINKLEQLYQLGYDDAKNQYKDILAYLS
jgi:predicted patatin/cPLA2 family phospholipase